MHPHEDLEINTNSKKAAKVEENYHASKQATKKRPKETSGEIGEFPKKTQKKSTGLLVPIPVLVLLVLALGLA